jgi:acyl carrier protein
MSTGEVEIEEAVLDILTEHARVGREGLAINTSLEDAGIDSLAVVEIVFTLEEQFDIQVPQADDVSKMFDDFKKVGDVVEIVRRLVEQKTAS